MLTCKWPEVLTVSSTTSQRMMEALCTFFGRYGLPEQLVSDNGPRFTSGKFVHFLCMHGIEYIRSAPYHPLSNGQVERFA